jgi:hypothetical protein
VRAHVGGDSPGHRVDPRDGLLPELDGLLDNVAVVQPYVVGGLSAEHHVELRVSEVPGVVAVEQRDADRVAHRLREPRREFQSSEAGAQNQDELHPDDPTAPRWAAPPPASSAVSRE